MNDAWDPTEDLEPLDDTSLGLLAEYRDGSGPSEDAEARMLAGLRTRLSADSNADEPATAVPPETTAAPRNGGASSNARTFAIAAVAFAAGVALTVSLDRPDTQQDSRPGSSGEDEHVVRRHDARQPAGVRTETSDPRRDATAPSLGPIGVATVAPKSWPLSIVDLAKPPGTTEIEPVEGSRPRVPSRPDESGDGTSTAPARRHTGDGPRNRDTTEGATASRGPLRGVPAPTAPGRGTALQGPWAPSVGGGAAGVGIASAARNPAAGGPAPTTPNAGSGSSNAGGDGSSDAPAKEPPPADEPPPSDAPEPEPEDEDEPPRGEACSEELDACLADAEAFCDFSDPACETVHDFCFMRNMSCLGDEDVPLPHDYPPDEPEPDDCDTDYNICMMEADVVCVLEKLGPEECEQWFAQCDELIAMCYGEPPPEPW